MEIWSLFINAIVQSISFLTSEVGIIEAIAIILFTSTVEQEWMNIK